MSPPSGRSSVQMGTTRPNSSRKRSMMGLDFSGRRQSRARTAVISSIAQRVLVMREGDPVEYGTAEQVFSDPQHEYTRMLLDAVPRIDDEVSA